MPVLSPVDAKDIMPDAQYVKELTAKKRIVLHHTAGGHRPDYTIQGWETDPERIATAFVVGGKSTTNGDAAFDGKTYQAFNTDFWAWHLGAKGTNGVYDKDSVGVEICNYGGLTPLKNGTFLNYVKKPVPADQVCDLGYVWRGYRYYHAYTDAQIAELAEIIKYLHDVHKMKFEKGRVFTVADFETDIVKFSKHTVNFHVNFRADKNDMSPQPKLIAMLNRVHA